MNVCEEYIEKLCEREPNLSMKSFPKSNLSQSDIQQIEATLGYSLPDQYKDFLVSRQAPNICKAYISLCGRSSVFWDTFSREENSYIQRTGDDVLVDLNWYGISGICASDWLEHLKELVGDMYIFVEAGYIWLGDFHKEDYFIFYDLTTGKVLKIHNGDIDENELFWDALDKENPNAIRFAMEKAASGFCPDFNTFLRLICTGELYDEDKMLFVICEEATNT